MDPTKFLYHPMRLLDHREMEYRFCMQNIQIEDGLFLEFGVYKGQSINILSKLKPNKIFHGFDTFTGLPEEWDMGGGGGEEGAAAGKRSERKKERKKTLCLAGGTVRFVVILAWVFIFV